MEIEYDFEKDEYLARDSYLGNQQIKRHGVVEKWTHEKLVEYQKCASDPLYFIENYMKIITLDHGLVNIELYDYQRGMIQTFHENRFSIALTPRQAAKTTSVVSYLLWYTLFNADKVVAILANKGATAKEILARYVLALENLPFFLQPGCRVLNKGKILFSNNTKIIAASTSSSSIRGESVNCLYCDEMAFINDAETFYTSTYPVITAGTSSKVIITSTPNGVGNMFHTLWLGAITKTNSYVPFRVYWQDVPGRDEKWKEETIKNTSQRQFEQEHEGSFLGSGRTLIDGNKLMGFSAQNPIRTNSEGTVSIYEDPKEDHSYVMTVDVARGRGQDHSAFSIIDVTESPMKQVATFYDNMISPLLFPVVLNKYGKQYNDAFVIVETNDNGSMVVNSLFQDLEYENLYNEVRGGRTMFGVETTKRVKMIGCSTLKDLVEENRLLIYDKNTIQELCSFIAKGNSYEAETGNNDDMVMTLVLFSWFTSVSLFQSLTDINIRNELFEKEMKNLEDELTPIGILGNPSIDEPEVPKLEEFGGQLWQEVKW
jgi:hypothetical protein